MKSLVVFVVVITLGLAVPIHFDNGRNYLSEEIVQLLDRERKLSPEVFEVNPNLDNTIGSDEHSTDARTFHKLQKKTIPHQPLIHHHHHHQPYYSVQQYRDNMAKEPEVTDDHNKFRITGDHQQNLEKNINIAKEAGESIKDDFEKTSRSSDWKKSESDKTFHGGIETAKDDLNLVQQNFSDSELSRTFNSDTLTSTTIDAPTQVFKLSTNDMTKSLKDVNEDLKTKNANENLTHHVKFNHEKLKVNNVEIKDSNLKTAKFNPSEDTNNNQEILSKAIIGNNDAEMNELYNTQKINDDSITNFMKSVDEMENEIKLLTILEKIMESKAYRPKLKELTQPNAKSNDGSNLEYIALKTEENNVRIKKKPQSAIISLSELKNTLIEPILTEETNIMIAFPSDIMQAKLKEADIEPISLEPKSFIVVETQANEPNTEHVSSLLMKTKATPKQFSYVRHDPKVLRLDSNNISKIRSEHRWTMFHPHTQSRGSYGLGGMELYGNVNSGSGLVVSVFPNDNKNCDVPLLVSCTPSVVSGSLSKFPNSGYSAPAYRASIQHKNIF